MGGTFLTFEGQDGAGKSSHIQPLADSLRSQGFDVLLTREPGGTPLAEKIRSLILHEEMDVLTETMLAFAARRDHIEQVIRPALAEGKFVICDRFTDSTYAYQGYGGKLPLDVIAQMEKCVLQNESGSILRPDLTLWFDVEPDVAFQRMSGRAEGDRFERQKVDFFNRVRLGYFNRSADPRIIRIDSGKPQSQVLEDVLSVVDAYVWGRPDELVSREEVVLS
jgi:dTMP kinase